MFRHLDIDKNEREIGNEDPQCNTVKKNDSTTKQDMKDCGVAGSSVVLKSEFTTHTKENTFGEESYTKTITTQNEGTYDTIDSTKLPSIIAIV